jgi:hypothetical protein
LRASGVVGNAARARLSADGGAILRRVPVPSDCAQVLSSALALTAEVAYGPWMSTKTVSLMKSTRAIFFACLLGLSGGLAFSQDARADDCASASLAAIAQAKVPHAIVHVVSVPGQAPVRTDIIIMPDKAYAQVNGAWRATGYSAQDQIDSINAANKRATESKQTCQKLASEVIAGESASVLQMRSETNGKSSEGRFWMSDKTGLPLKSEIHISNGIVVADEYRYDNIAAPSGVK